MACRQKCLTWKSAWYLGFSKEHTVRKPRNADVLLDYTRRLKHNPGTDRSPNNDVQRLRRFKWSDCELWKAPKPRCSQIAIPASCVVETAIAMRASTVKAFMSALLDLARLVAGRGASKLCCAAVLWPVGTTAVRMYCPALPPHHTWLKRSTVENVLPENAPLPFKFVNQSDVYVVKHCNLHIWDPIIE